MVKTKKCSICNVEKPYTKEVFGIKSSNKSGLSASCRICERKRDKARKDKIKAFHKTKNIKRKRPINPRTNEPYKKGEKVGDLYVIGVRTDTWAEDHLPLALVTKEQFIRQYCGLMIASKKRHYKTGLKPWEVTITKEYLIEIFPKDMMCPIFNIKMSLIAHKPNSMNLDRIDCTKGYIEGNVAWISTKANRLKNNGTSKELYQIADWLKSKGV